MAKIFYFINIRYLPPILFRLPIDFQSFLEPAFFNPNDAMSLKNNLVDIMLQETKKVDKRRIKLKMEPFFKDLKREQLEEWIEIDQRFLAQVRIDGLID